MVVAVCRVELIIPGANSLKEKRMVLRSVLDRLRGRFHVSMAEVGNQDLHQRASIGFAVVSNEGAHATSIVDQIAASFDGARDCYVADRALEVISMGSSTQQLGVRGGDVPDPEDAR